MVDRQKRQKKGGGHDTERTEGNARAVVVEDRSRLGRAMRVLRSFIEDYA